MDSPPIAQSHENTKHSVAMAASRDGGDAASTSEHDVEQGRSFDVVVKALDGNEWRIPVQPSTTVLQIKNGVKPHPVDQQRLIYLGEASTCIDSQTPRPHVERAIEICPLTCSDPCCAVVSTLGQIHVCDRAGVAG